MKKLNKFEIAAELNTEEKRDTYLFEIYKLDQTIEEMTEYIDVVKLASENHPIELLLSKEWQQGYECCRSRTQQAIEVALEGVLTGSSTTLNAAAMLCIGGDIVNELGYHSFIDKIGRNKLLSNLVKNADNFNADAFCMYDPEKHPDLDKHIKNGQEQLFYWTEDKLEHQYNCETIVEVRQC